jgi:hypothetical protein
MSDEIRRITRLIRRSYPTHPSTFSKCPARRCTNAARGYEVCAYCLEAELGKLIGENQAKEVHNKFREYAGIR